MLETLALMCAVAGVTGVALALSTLIVALFIDNDREGGGR